MEYADAFPNDHLFLELYKYLASVSAVAGAQETTGEDAIRLLGSVRVLCRNHTERYDHSSKHYSILSNMEAQMPTKSALPPPLSLAPRFDEIYSNIGLSELGGSGGRLSSTDPDHGIQADPKQC